MERGQKGSDSSLALRTVQLQGENIVIQQPPLVPKHVTTTLSSAPGLWTAPQQPFHKEEQNRILSRKGEIVSQQQHTEQEIRRSK